MNNSLLDALSNKKDLVFCYGNIIPSINKLICSARHAYVIQTGTRYDLETTIISDISDNILENYYKNIFTYNSISHNFSICKINNFYIGVGGVSQPSYLVGNNLAPHCHWGNYWKGLYLMKSKDCEIWSTPVKIIDRDWGFKNNCCSFDSQPSLVYNEIRDIYYLYCRYNPACQKRRLQVFISNDIDNWQNNYTEVKLNKDINVYTTYMFTHNNKVLGIIRYYNNDFNVTNVQMLKDNAKIGLISSNDGINFTFEKDIIDNYNYQIHGDVTQGHEIIDNKLVIYLLCQNGNLNEYNIFI